MYFRFIKIFLLIIVLSYNNSMFSTEQNISVEIKTNSLCIFSEVEPNSDIFSSKELIFTNIIEEIKKEQEIIFEVFLLSDYYSPIWQPPQLI